MGVKLIKTTQELFVNYHLKNESGHTIATTLFPVPTEVEYAANSKGITLQKLSHENCQAIERGYDLDELCEETFEHMGYHSTVTPHEEKQFKLGYRLAFQKALELMGDKKYSEGQMKTIFSKTLENAPSTESHTRMISDMEYRHSVMDELYDRITKSLQQTEWDVEIEMECRKVLVNGYKNQPANVIGFVAAYEEQLLPKLDGDGCLILKLKSE